MYLNLARKIIETRRRLAMQEKQGNHKDRYVGIKKRRKMRKTKSRRKSLYPENQENQENRENQKNNY